MNNSTLNITTNGASTNSTSLQFNDNLSLEMYIFLINVLFGFPTQSYVIWLIVKGTGNGISSEFFFLNLAVCEIFCCLDCLLFLLTIWFSGLMVFGLFLQGLVSTGRPLFQCLICVERYLAVVHPVTFLKYKPLRYKAICCTFAWLLCFGSCLVSYFTLTSFNIVAHAWFFSIVFIVLLFIQLFCLVAVLRALKQSGPGERGREREEENHMKRRAFHIILITTISMVTIYVPMCISGFFIIMIHRYLSEFWIPSLLSYVLGGFLQPVLYLHRCGKLFCFASF
nr:C5a anaphylatoxin chemotactic receptor 1-like [Misgurnus anguillicaudatus]